jgi:hypothetical protein
MVYRPYCVFHRSDNEYVHSTRCLNFTVIGRRVRDGRYHQPIGKESGEVKDEKIRQYYKHILIGLACMFVLTVNGICAYADSYPSNAPFAGGAFIDVQTAQLGRVIIYVPIANKDFQLSTLADTDTLVNITAGTINGEVFYGTNYGNQRQLRFTRYNTAEYNINTTGAANWQPLTVTTIYNTNLQIADQDHEPVQLYDRNHTTTVILIILVAGVLICLLFKKSRT